MTKGREFRGSTPAARVFDKAVFYHRGVDRHGLVLDDHSHQVMPPYHEGLRALTLPNELRAAAT